MGDLVVLSDNNAFLEDCLLGCSGTSCMDCPLGERVSSVLDPICIRCTAFVIALLLLLLLLVVWLLLLLNCEEDEDRDTVPGDSMGDPVGGGGVDDLFISMVCMSLSFEALRFFKAFNIVTEEDDDDGDCG